MRETFPENSPFITEDPRKDRWAIPYHHEALNCRVENLIEKNSQAFRGKRVLDLGCHFGTFAYASLAHGAVHVHGVDSDRALIEKAAELFSRTGISRERYHFSRGEISSFLADQPDDSYDTILCLGVFYYLHDPVTTLGEMKRVAGKFIVLDTFTAYYGACMSREGDAVFRNTVDGTYDLPMVLYPRTQSEKKGYRLPGGFQGEKRDMTLLTLPTEAALERFFGMHSLRYRRLDWNSYGKGRRKWSDFTDADVKKMSHWADLYAAGIRVSYLIEK